MGWDEREKREGKKSTGMRKDEGEKKELVERRERGKKINRTRDEKW